jgi:ElaB/YqjD/DUF883 family membrane-anchored ribosome-binding protein
MANELQLYSKLNDEVVLLADSFSNLLRAARVPADDADQEVRGRERKAPGYLLDVVAEKLVYNAHHCIATSSELKKSAILSDFASLIDSTRTVRGAADKYCDDADVTVRKVREAAQSLLAELEEHYYSSPYRSVPAVSAAESNQQ